VPLLSLAAIVLVIACFGAMVLLHIVRTDLDPVRQVMSEYANGRFGWFMTAAFYAMGLACLALAVRTERPTALGRPRPSAVVCRRFGAAPRAAHGSQPRE
jgi:di/tricarboxylate transporter